MSTHRANDWLTPKQAEELTARADAAERERDAISRDYGNLVRTYNEEIRALAAASAQLARVREFVTQKIIDLDHDRRWHCGGNAAHSLQDQINVCRAILNEITPAAPATGGGEQ